MFDNLYSSKDISTGIAKALVTQTEVIEEVYYHACNNDGTIDIDYIQQYNPEPLSRGTLKFLEMHNEIIVTDPSVSEYILQLKEHKEQVLSENGFYMVQDTPEHFFEQLSETAPSNNTQLAVVYDKDREYFYSKEGWEKQQTEITECIVSNSMVVIPSSKYENKQAVISALNQVMDN
jgi:hypothetical protein